MSHILARGRASQFRKSFARGAEHAVECFAGPRRRSVLLSRPSDGRHLTLTFNSDADACVFCLQVLAATVGSRRPAAEGCYEASQLDALRLLHKTCGDYVRICEAYEDTSDGP